MQSGHGTQTGYGNRPGQESKKRQKRKQNVGWLLLLDEDGSVGRLFLSLTKRFVAGVIVAWMDGLGRVDMDSSGRS